MKKITVTLDDRKLEIKKLPLGKYAELLNGIHDLPKSLTGLEGITNDQLFAQLPTIIAKALPDFISLLVTATDLTKEEIEQLGLDEVAAIFIGVIEVNRYREVYDTLKKAFARAEKKTPSTGSTG